MRFYTDKLEAVDINIKEYEITDVRMVGAPLGCRSEYSGGARIAPRTGRNDLILQHKETKEMVRIRFISDNVLDDLKSQGKVKHTGTYGTLQYAYSQGFQLSDQLFKHDDYKGKKFDPIVGDMVEAE